MRLARTILFAKEVPKLSAFYCEALGLARLPTEYPPEDWAVLDAGGTQLALHRVPEPWNADIRISDPPQVRSGSPHKMVFEVEDIEKVRGELLARGVPELPSAPADRPESRVRADFVDPEGNVFQITVADG